MNSLCERNISYLCDETWKWRHRVMWCVPRCSNSMWHFSLSNSIGHTRHTVVRTKCKLMSSHEKVCGTRVRPNIVRNTRMECAQSTMAIAVSVVISIGDILVIRNFATYSSATNSTHSRCWAEKNSLANKSSDRRRRIVFARRTVHGIYSGGSHSLGSLCNKKAIKIHFLWCQVQFPSDIWCITRTHYHTSILSSPPPRTCQRAPSSHSIVCLLYIRRCVRVYILDPSLHVLPHISTGVNIIKIY